MAASIVVRWMGMGHMVTISQCLGVNAAQTGEQNQPDAVRARHAGDGFQVAADHGLDDDRRASGRAVQRGPHCAGIAQADMHEAEVAFVRDALGDAFQHDGVTQSVRRGARIIGGRAEPSVATTGTPKPANSARLSGSVSCRAGRAGAAWRRPIGTARATASASRRSPPARCPFR